MFIVIDNYDSFTYNLVQYLGELGAKLEVYRNDEISIDEIEKRKYKGIIISPGPGRPENAGISIELIKHFYKITPILGVCLGHQAIACAFGGRITYAKKLMHGKTSKIRYVKTPIYKGLPNPFIATRYHSLIIDKKSLPSSLKINAYSEENEIMGIEHKKYKVFGVQFHPESILTNFGKKILKNFINITKN